MSAVMWVLFGVNAVAFLFLGWGFGRVIVARRRDSIMFEKYTRDMAELRLSSSDGDSFAGNQ